MVTFVVCVYEIRLFKPSRVYRVVSVSTGHVIVRVVVPSPLSIVLITASSAESKRFHLQRFFFVRTLGHKARFDEFKLSQIQISIGSNIYSAIYTTLGQAFHLTV